MEGNLITLIVLATLLVLSALSSAAETAFTSVNRIKVRSLSQKKVTSAVVLDELLEHPARYLSTILLLNNLINIAFASLVTVLTATYFHSYVAAISTGVATFLILVYGEIFPKTYASQNAEKIALFMSRPVSFLCTVFYPLARLFIFVANIFTRLLGGKVTREGPFVTEEEIKTLVSVGEEEGVIEKEEKEMIHHIFEFGDTIVKEVMVPRMDIVCVEKKAPVKSVLDLVVKEGHSRIPVYEESIDDIVGIVYAKDLLIHLASGKKEVSLSDLIHPAYYIPEGKRVSELLRELQKKRQHMAVVVDEFGGTAGLVTIEDLLEEIVGEIFDEYDFEETLVEFVDDNNLRVDARVSLDEVSELLGIETPETEWETVGGLVYKLIGKIPTAGEKVTFDSLVFTVEKVVGRRISKVLITKEPKETPEEKKEKEEEI